MKNVFVTGGSSGIGEAIARACAAAGWEVYIGYSTGKDRAAKIENEIRQAGGAAHAVRLMLEDGASIISAMDFVQKTSGRLDAVVLCGAPAPTLASFSKIGQVDLEKHMRVNILGNYALITRAWEMFFKKEKSGHVVAILSAAASTPPWPGMTSYVTAKRGLQALLECAVQDLGKSGLRATLLYPDHTETPMMMNQERLIVEMALSKKKNNRFLQPAEVAQVALDCLNNPPGNEFIASRVIAG